VCVCATNIQFNDHLQLNLGYQVPPQFTYTICSRTEPLEVSCTGFLQPRCPSCDLTTRVEAPTPNHGISCWPHPFFIHLWTPDGKGVAPFTLVFQHQHPTHASKHSMQYLSSFLDNRCCSPLNLIFPDRWAIWPISPCLLHWIFYTTSVRKYTLSQWTENIDTDTLFTLCVALAFCHCFSVVRCPCSLFDITPPNSFLFIIIIIIIVVMAVYLLHIGMVRTGNNYTFHLTRNMGLQI